MEIFNPVFTRSELLKTLSDMGIAIPANSKLPNDALEKRLKQAINASQALSSVISRPPLDCAQYTAWPPPGKRSAYAAIRRSDLNEASKTFAANLQGLENFTPLYSNAFMDVRQTLMSLAKSWDEGIDIAIMQDQEKEKCVINIRVIEVLEVNESTPLLIVLYLSATSANPWPCMRWIQQLQVERVDFQLPEISSTHLEQKLMLKILDQNSKFLPPDLAPQRTESEKDFKLSFLLPMGPLPFEDVGKLNLDTGCGICGKKVVSRCSQCQAASYCGAECQKSDWPSHKSMCRSLKGGTWLKLPFVNSLPGPDGSGMSTFVVNRYNTKSPKPVDPNLPPPNVHSDKAFLIKIQPGVSSMLIYDRQRSIEAHFVEDKEPASFRRVREEIQGPRGGHSGIKMYRWVKRVGDWELDVCLDRAPQEKIMW